MGHPVVAGIEEIRDAGQVVEGGEGDSGPDKGDEPGHDDGDDGERVHGSLSFAEEATAAEIKE
jgi:hypothetical protein